MGSPASLDSTSALEKVGVVKPHHSSMIWPLSRTLCDILRMHWHRAGSCLCPIWAGILGPEL